MLDDNLPVVKCLAPFELSTKTTLEKPQFMTRTRQTSRLNHVEPITAGHGHRELRQ